MKKYIFPIFTAILLVYSVNICAKDVNSKLGIRVEMNDNDEYAGPDYKYYFNKHFAGECFVLSDFENGIEFYGLAEYVGFIPGIPENFSYYLGAGIHAGSWKGYDDSFVLGLDGIAGLQYKFNEMPVSLSLDWHPLFNIMTDKDERFWLQKFGISVRYSF